MTPERLSKLLAKFPTRRIAVIGDFFLDKYLDVDPSLVQTSVETGRTAHQVVRVRSSPGAAGTVVNNLTALTAGTVYAVGATGDDGESFTLRQELAKQGVNCEGLIRHRALMTPTYLKPRDIRNPHLAGEHPRYDTKNRTRTPEEVITQILDYLDKLLPEVDAVIVLDQVEDEDCGVITTRVRDEIAKYGATRKEVVFWADSRRHIKKFRNVITKPNQFEVVGKDDPKPGEEVRFHTLVTALPQMRMTTCGPIVVTRGSLGAVVTEPDFTRVPAVHLEGPLDTTGAGDSVTAAAVLALSSGASLIEATLAGMLAASITSQQLATTGVATPDQIQERLDLWIAQQGASGIIKGR